MNVAQVALAQPEGFDLKTYQGTLKVLALELDSEIEDICVFMVAAPAGEEDELRARLIQ
jgi:hypothetical protein